jgi:hypothetical protein
MAAITLTPVDISTAPVVVNSDILYHVFTIGGVTRVFFSKGGKSPYQIDVQETAAAIAALCPNLVEVTTVNGAEYLFIGSGGAGPGLGIMFIEADGSGSKITFKYNEESGNTMFYSLDAPSVIAARINALVPLPSTQIITAKKTLTSADVLTLGAPFELIPAPGAGYAIQLISMSHKYIFGTTPYSTISWHVGPTSLLSTAPYMSLQFKLAFPDDPSNTGDINTNYDLYSPAATVSNMAENDSISIWSQASNPTGGDGSFEITMTYILVAV